MAAWRVRSGPGNERMTGTAGGLESTRSNSRANSECGENHSKKPRMCKSLGTPDAMASSPSSSRAASQRSADDTHHSWPQEKDDPTLKHPQRPQHSQQSSQVRLWWCGVAEVMWCGGVVWWCLVLWWSSRPRILS
ncbi:hypothetical protein E2C01_074596 [Portunus trituberculatus]|uniref:Uncharacterized protein n=1 Tax=Portunus trituberculatus TaxID=210409 RepID=A0A5B7ICN1_PORTR|nr:hypothetical protein [Portunus trituberculatus]